jgi:hypothetical protein
LTCKLPSFLFLHSICLRPNIPEKLRALYTTSGLSCWVNVWNSQLKISTALVSSTELDVHIRFQTLKVIHSVA